MIKTVTYIGDPIDDRDEFLELEKSKHMTMALWEFEQYLRRLQKDFDMFSTEEIWNQWHEATSEVRDVINS